MAPLPNFLPDDSALITGLRTDNPNRQRFENQLFDRYAYFIRDGTHKHRLAEDDCATAYADTVLTVIDHIKTGRFAEKSGLKTYLYKIFSNKCVDLIRKNTTNRESVHHSTLSFNDSPMEIQSDVESILQKMILAQDMARLYEQLNILGEKCRTMLLAWGAGQTDAEIAQKMEYSSAGVAKTSRLRCLEKLKTNYDKSA
jgi:RNA polymerase sigma factor (sigma-70 family)